MRAIDYFDKEAEAFPERIAIIDRSKRYSYRETQASSRRIASAMRAGGLRDEDRVAIFSPNDGRILLCMLGLMRAGGVWVPLNHRNALDANVQFLNYSDTSWLFYHSGFQEQVREIKAQAACVRHYICIDTENEGDPSLEQFMAKGSENEELDWGDPRGNLDRLVGLVPTGGTTGPAKGVMVTSLSWGTMTETANQCLRCEGVESVCLSAAPLSHAAGVVAFAMFSLGATNLVLPAFDAQAVLESIPRYRVTHMFLPPTALYALLAHPQVGEFDYSSLRRMLIVAAPVSPDKLKRSVEVFGPCLCQSYGQTEAPMYLTWLDPMTLAAAAAGDHPERLRSCGKPTLAVRLAIMDDAGVLLRPGETGEIVARGALVSAGYYNLPQATAEIRMHGWHHTGDVGYRDEEGFFYIVDRKKDMIITGGENVYCAEVENALASHPAVAELAVIGAPHEHWGETPAAVAVLHPGASLTIDELREWGTGRLARYKLPTILHVVPSLPRNASGKVTKTVLRRQFGDPRGQRP
jgi:fatty-acyl-CoA synthase